MGIFKQVAEQQKTGGVFKQIAGQQKSAEKSLPQKAVKETANLGFGALKGVGSTLVSLGQIPLKIASVIPALRPEAQAGIEMGEELKKGILAPKGTSQTIGRGAEQIGEFFLPVGLEAKVAGKLAKIPELAKNAPLLKKVAQSFFKGGTKAVASGVEFGGKTLLQSGGDIKKAGEAGVIAGTIPIAGKVLKTTGQIIAEKVIPLSAKEAKFVQSYRASVPFWERVLTGKLTAGPTTAGKTAFTKGLVGTESTIGVKAKRGANNLWNSLINPALKKSPIKQNMSSFWKEAEEKIIANNPELSRQNSLLEALNALKLDYRNVKDVPLSVLQKFKEGWAKFVPQKAYKGQDIAGAFNAVKNTVAGIARDKIYAGLGNDVKQAYFDYGNLLGLQELGQKALTGGKLKGGFGSFWNAIKDMALVPVGTIGGQVIYKLGQEIELVGKQGASKLSDLIPEK